MRGKVQLIAAGVPAWYLMKIFRHLYGLMEDVEPLFASPRDMLAPRSPPRVVDRVEVVDDDTEEEGEGPNGQPAGTTVLSSVGAAGVVSRKRARNPYYDQEHRPEQRQRRSSSVENIARPGNVPVIRID